MRSDEDLKEAFGGKESLILDEDEGVETQKSRKTVKKQSQSRMTGILDDVPDEGDMWQVEELPDGTIIKSRTRQTSEIKKSGGFLCFGKKAPKPPEEFRSQSEKPK
jgi:hypothetical protein